MTKIVDINRGKNKEYLDLYTAITCHSDDLLKESFEKNLDLDIGFSIKNLGNNYFPTPLMLSVRSNNAKAVRLISNKMRLQGTLNLTEEAHSTSLFHHAIRVGNPEIVRYLLTYKADANLSSHEETPIMTAVRKLPTFSLINDGEWGTDVNKADLLEWYNGKKDFPNNASTVTWKGSLNIIEQVLKAGGDVTASDNFGVSALDLINSVNDPIHLKRRMFQDDNCKLEFVSADQDQIVFKTNLVSRNSRKEQTVNVTYDVREVRKLLEKYKEQNKNKGYDSKLLKEVQNSVSNHEVKLNADQEAFDLKCRIKKLEENRNTEKFYDCTQDRLKTIFDAYKLLSSGLIVRNKNSKLDTASTIVRALKEHVPTIFKLPFSIFEGMLSKGADEKEKSRCEKISHLLPSDTLEYTRKIACDMTEALIHHAESIRPGSIEKLTLEDMQSLSNRLLIIVIAKLHDVNQLEINPQLMSKERAQLLMNKLIENDKFSDTFVELLEERIKKSITPPSTPVHTAYDISKARAAKQQKEANNQENGKAQDKKCVIM